MFEEIYRLQAGLEFFCAPVKSKRQKLARPSIYYVYHWEHFGSLRVSGREILMTVASYVRQLVIRQSGSSSRVESDEIEPVSATTATPSLMLRQVDASQQERRHG